MKSFDQELVSGSIIRSVWKLAWPMILLQLISGIHGFIDHVLVGNFVASESNAANAAIGVAWQYFLVMVVFVASLFHGMGVLIARYSGKKDRDTLSQIAYETFLTSILIHVGLFAPFGYFLAPAILDLANAHPDVKEHALPYLRILYTCSAPLFLMFMLNGAMQATGDTKTPLKLGILTTALNILLSYLLITGAGPLPKLGTIGAAIGTCFGPLPSVIIAITLIVKRKLIIQPPKRYTLIPDLQVMKTVARIGIPTGIQAVLLNIGGAWLYRIIGTLPDAASAQAAYAICYAQLFSWITWACFGIRAAASTILGQNIGAGDTERGKRGVYVAAFLGMGWAFVWGILYWAIPDTLLALFAATDEPVRTYGMTFLHYLAFTGIFLALGLAFTGGLQGAGDTMSPMVIAFITQIGVLLGICLFFQYRGTLTTDIVWKAILITQFTRAVMTLIVFFHGRWRHKMVELAT
jgi:putative MATE family efflux protein